MHHSRMIASSEKRRFGRHRARVAAACLSTCCLFTAATTATAEDAYAAHRLVAEHAVDHLPREFAAIVVQHRNAIVRVACELGSDQRDPDEPHLYKPGHHIRLDVAAEGGTREMRLAAFDQFPRDRESALRLFKSIGEHNGGELPWTIQECQTRLKDAIRIGDPERIALRMGHLIHFCTDAVDPFRVSVGAGKTADRFVEVGSAGGVHPSNVDHSVAERFSAGLVRRHQADYLLRWSERVDEATAPILEPDSVPGGFVWSAMRDALASVDEILAADEALLPTAEVTDRKSFDSRADDYYAGMNARVGDNGMRQLVTAIQLAQVLILQAWESAGRPALDAAAAEKPPASPIPGGPAVGAFVGSRLSDVFHRPDCPFAQQINKENLVTFAKAGDATGAGKRPCRRCKPE
ncbi:MAG: hypothetical protein HOP29_02290 [Phycisphaerales bacterium]|nr:hypothetical protein [Phycisphaerales bacterium]